jgi:hypothetical protein
VCEEARGLSGVLRDFQGAARALRGRGRAPWKRNEGENQWEGYLEGE